MQKPNGATLPRGEGETVSRFERLVCFPARSSVWRHLFAESLKQSTQLIERVAIFQGELQQAVGADEFEFFADVGPMRFDGARADEQFGGDFLGRFAEGDA